MPKERTATHGSYTFYAAGCRCGDCTDWKSDYDAGYRSRRKAELMNRSVPVTHQAVPVHTSKPDPDTGEVPMTAGDRKLAAILATHLKPATTYTTQPVIPQRSYFDADGVEHEYVEE